MFTVFCIVCFYFFFKAEVKTNSFQSEADGLYVYSETFDVIPEKIYSIKVSKILVFSLLYFIFEI